MKAGNHIRTTTTVLSLVACLCLFSGSIPVSAQEFHSPTRIILIDADMDSEIADLPEDASISLAEMPTHNLNIQAIPSSDQVTRVKFKRNATEVMENVAPFALGGDISGDFNAWRPALGTHSLEISFLAQDGSVIETRNLKLTVTK